MGPLFGTFQCFSGFGLLWLWAALDGSGQPWAVLGGSVWAGRLCVVLGGSGPLLCAALGGSLGGHGWPWAVLGGSVRVLAALHGPVVRLCRFSTGCRPRFSALYPPLREYVLPTVITVFITNLFRSQITDYRIILNPP